MKSTYQQTRAFKAYQQARNNLPEWEWALTPDDEREQIEDESLRHDLAFLGLTVFAHASEQTPRY